MSNKKVDFSPYLDSAGWKDEWANEKKFSEILRVDNISKITNVVVYGLVEKLTKSPFYEKKKDGYIILMALAPLDFPPMQEVDETSFCKKYSSALRAKKNYSKNRQDWYNHIFSNNNREVKKSDGEPSPKKTKTDTFCF